MNIKENAVTSMPACRCQAIIDEENHTINVVKLCHYHQTVSKNGLGKIFTGS